MCKESGGGSLTVKESINKGIDKCIKAGNKVKEYMVDDTAKDLKNLLEVKKKEDPHSHLPKYNHGGEGLLYCAKCNAWHKGDINWDDDSEGN